MHELQTGLEGKVYHSISAVKGEAFSCLYNSIFIATIALKHHDATQSIQSQFNHQIPVASISRHRHFDPWLWSIPKIKGQNMLSLYAATSLQHNLEERLVYFMTCWSMPLKILANQNSQNTGIALPCPLPSRARKKAVTPENTQMQGKFPKEDSYQLLCATTKGSALAEISLQKDYRKLAFSRKWALKSINQLWKPRPRQIDYSCAFKHQDTQFFTSESYHQSVRFSSTL